MTSLVSIIIPVYNSGLYLNSCISSVISQNYPSLEIIIINDGSTDNSEEIINEYIKRDSRIKLVSQHNQGLGATRNKGISLSRGRYVFFLDSDDLLPKYAIQKMVSIIERSNADIAVGKVLRFNEERKYVPIRHMEFNLYNDNAITTATKNPELIQDSIACNKLWKKEFLTNNNLSFSVGKYYEDLNFTLKGLVLAKNIEVMKETVYLWRVRSIEDNPSITQQQMKFDNTKDRINALQNNREWLINNGYSRKIIDEHDYKILLDILRLHVSKYCLVDTKRIKDWERIIIQFLQQIPTKTASTLPDKEKILYNLLMTNNLGELELFSQFLTNTESAPIVKQLKDKFILEGSRKELNITHFLKPKVVVTDLIKNRSAWEISGTITIPKASHSINGEIIGISRANKRRVIIDEVINYSVDEALVYPFEKQNFNVTLKINDLEQVQKEEVFDLYFHLPDYPDYKKTRIISIVKGSNNLNLGRQKFTLYRTNNGNLSLAVRKITLKYIIKRILKIFIKK